MPHSRRRWDRLSATMLNSRYAESGLDSSFKTFKTLPLATEVMKLGLTDAPNVVVTTTFLTVPSRD
jgi:hypothetical protein